MGAERPPADTLRLVILGGGGRGGGRLSAGDSSLCGGWRKVREEGEEGHCKDQADWAALGCPGGDGEGGGFKLQVLFMDGLYQG